MKPVFLGVANDAGSFSKAGFRATTLLLFKAPKQLVAFYHQRCDAFEILTIKPLLTVLKLISSEYATAGSRQGNHSWKLVRLWGEETHTIPAGG